MFVSEPIEFKSPLKQVGKEGEDLVVSCGVLSNSFSILWSRQGGGVMEGI